MSTLVPSFLDFFIILAGNKDNYKNLDAFEFLPDTITTYALYHFSRIIVFQLALLTAGDIYEVTGVY